jgi:four helix bundle protein
MATPKLDDLPIFVKWTAFLAWLLPTTEKFPKKVRFTFTNRIDNLALDVVEDLVEARYRRDKRAILAQANLRLEKLRILLRLCHDLHYLPHTSYEHAMRAITEVGKMLGGWRKHQETV